MVKVNVKIIPTSGQTVVSKGKSDRMTNAMKRFIFLIAISSAFFGCSDENETNQIVGKWKLTQINLDSWNSYVQDYSDKNVIYDFKSNGILVVNGNQNAPHSDGEHAYFFGKDKLGGQSDPEILLVKIDGYKWTYNLSGEQMLLSKAYVDGETLIFVRK